MSGIRRWFFYSLAGFDLSGKKGGEIGSMIRCIYIYIGPKGARFGRVFGKSADFSEKKICGEPAAVRGDCRGRRTLRIVGCLPGDVRNDGEAADEREGEFNQFRRGSGDDDL
jgi:hypothetical protein